MAEDWTASVNIEHLIRIGILGESSWLGKVLYGEFLELIDGEGGESP